MVVGFGLVGRVQLMEVGVVPGHANQRGVVIEFGQASERSVVKPFAVAHALRGWRESKRGYQHDIRQQGPAELGLKNAK